jgi:hypothetical protein
MQIGKLGVSLMHSIEYDSVHGVLYGASNETGHLYTIDVFTGAATSVGPTGISAIGGLAYDPVHNVMYATDAGPARSTGLFTVDLATGASAWVGAFENQEAEHIVDLTFDERFGLFGVDNGLTDGAISQIFSIDPAVGKATFMRNLQRGNFLGLTFVVPEPTCGTLALWISGLLMVHFGGRKSRGEPRR